MHTQYEVYYNLDQVELFSSLEQAEKFYAETDIQYDAMIVCRCVDGRVRILEMRKGVK